MLACVLESAAVEYLGGLAFIMGSLALMIAIVPRLGRK